MKRQLLIVPIAVMLGITGTAAMAASNSSTSNNSNNDVFSTMDTNSDGQVNQSEFNEYYSPKKMFGQWDVDSNDEISMSEFSDGWYGHYDSNDDGSIDDNEAQEIATSDYPE